MDLCNTDLCTHTDLCNVDLCNADLCNADLCKLDFTEFSKSPPPAQEMKKRTFFKEEVLDLRCDWGSCVGQFLKVKFGFLSLKCNFISSSVIFRFT